MRRYAVPFPVLALLGFASAAAAAPANTCVFTISMTSGVDVNNLDFTVSYSAADGGVEGTPTQPECARALSGQAFAGFHDDDATKKLSVAIIRLTHFSSPIALAGCRFFYDTNEPVPGEFTVKVTNAGRDGGDDNINPRPTVQVTGVECPGELPSPTTTTTTLETSTTTLPGAGVCGFPVSSGVKPSASDALAALKAAVGGKFCDLCVCDINSNGSVGAGDALGILRAAVGIATPLVCPPC